MRIARALRLGLPRALGGGLFRGGTLLRDLLAAGRLGEAVLHRRHRFQAGLATLVLAATLGLAWSSTREPVEVGTAQAAAAGAGPAALPHGPACKVRYRVQRDTGTDFGAQLTLINTGAQVLADWRLEFAFPSGQRITDAPKRLTQRGRKVVLRAKAESKLRPGRSATVTLSGSYRMSNPLPLAFVLNGQQCRAEVYGAAVSPPAAPESSPAPSAEPRPAPRRSEPPAGRRPAPKKDRPGFSVTV
jgi:hypothetical protein